ncbi:MAG: ketoacyl-ACP synthase III [Flavobacteriales bacterium]|nr:ketoacyl-ACP synthase III [Flavobacteriales bacterium]
MSVKIIGSGSCVPNNKVVNSDFSNHVFLNADGSAFKGNNDSVIQKFHKITGILERRYADDTQSTSDIATIAAEKAIADAGIDKETIDYIIVAHNFGDIPSGSNQSDMIPSLGSKVKHLLQIKNPKCVAYDLIFGCPGWVEGMIQANAFINAGLAKRCLVIGAETLSRVTDPHDRDSMIYADGAGATIIAQSDEKGGILSHESATYTVDESGFLFYGKSYNCELPDNQKYIKMFGRKIYEFALTNVPTALQTCLDASGFGIHDIKKILIHQANEKMDEAIVDRFYKLYGEQVPKDIMPMIIHEFGNSSVATVPTLYDLIKNNQLGDKHSFAQGDVILLASVGAGMNINAIVYQV